MISIRSAIILASLAFAPTALGCPTHTVSLPLPAGDGPGKEVKELLDTPFVKLVSITLRQGTVLPDHAAPVAVTLQAVGGAGSVKVGEEVTPISAGQVLLIAPGVRHSVTPAGDAPLVVLVHFLKGGAAGEPHPGHAAGAACTCKDGASKGGEGKDGACTDGHCADGAQP